MVLMIPVCELMGARVIDNLFSTISTLDSLISFIFHTGKNDKIQQLQNQTRKKKSISCNACADDGMNHDNVINHTSSHQLTIKDQIVIST
jgi:hypothetical protein